MVHATVVEVVVLSFIGDHRSGSGSRGSRRLVENHGGGSRTHVVEELGLAKRYLTVVVLDAFEGRHVMVLGKILGEGA